MDVMTVCDFLKQAIKELKQITPAEIHQWKSMIVTPTSTSRQFRVTDFGTIIDFGYYEQKLPVIDHFIKVIETDHRFLQLVQQPGFPLYALQPEVMARRLLIDYVTEINQLGYDLSLAEIISKNFIESLERGKSTVVFYTVLRGLESDIEEYTFSNSIRIRRLSDTEVANLLAKTATDLAYFDDGIPQNRYVAEQIIEQSFKEFPSINVADDYFKNLVTALRLLKPGRVESQVTRTNYPHKGQIVTSEMMIGQPGGFPIDKSYSLSQSDVPELQSLFEAIQNKTLPQRLVMAISRINFASERIRPEDQLIDLMIAVEALYGGDGKTDLRYKLGLRCAAYLETTLESRREILSFMKKAYDKRSSLVHGSNSKKGLSTEAVVNELRRIVQVSIKQMIEDVANGRNMPDDDSFDELLLGNHSK